jgi:hypothetical protein
MVLLVMFVLVGAIAAGFAMLSSERTADDAAIQSQGAAALAETGLQQGVWNRAGLGLPSVPPVGNDSTRVELTGGYADVVTTLVRAAQGSTVPALYFVRARGVRTATGVVGAGNAVASASAFASYQSQTMTLQASMTSVNGIDYQGNAGKISGIDQCNPSAPRRAAVAVPTTPGFRGKTGPLEGAGSPPIAIIGPTVSAAASAVPFDWAGIVNGGAITPDFRSTANGVGFPAARWFTDNPSAWPTILVNNGPSPNTAFSLGAVGRGLLIVLGDLTLNGNSAGWNGVILVGGRLTSNGGNQIVGAIVTGLNAKLGYAVANNTLNGTKEFLFSSCQVTSALSSLGTFRVHPNTWANNFPTY